MGVDKLKKSASSLKPSSQCVVLAALDKLDKSAFVPPTTSTSTSTSTTGATAGEESSGVASKKTSTARGSSVGNMSVPVSSSAPGKGSKGSEEVLDFSLSNDGKKALREKDEKALKVLKWSFTAPRPEYITQLQDLSKGCVGKHLFSYMFSDDFRVHIKAIDALIDHAKADHPGVLANLDIILKWITLRFFDTNTAVLLRSLQLLQDLFDLAARQTYEMSEIEASSFLPYLLSKIGDKIESVRKDTHTLLRAMAKCYPPNKLFLYVLEGLKSKNAKQRAECLVEVDYMIATHGMNVCQVR